MERLTQKYRQHVARLQMFLAQNDKTEYSEKQPKKAIIFSKINNQTIVLDISETSKYLKKISGYLCQRLNTARLTCKTSEILTY